MFIVSSVGMRVCEFSSMSVMTPEVDLYDDEVYKLYVNGRSVGEYNKEESVRKEFNEILKALKNKDIIYQVRKEEDIV